VCERERERERESERKRERERERVCVYHQATRAHALDLLYPGARARQQQFF
jgi:hypothetical protein